MKRVKKVASRSNGRQSNGRKTPLKIKSPQRINLIQQAGEIERILQKAVRHELSIHKRLGNPVAVWKDGKVVIVPPEEIVLPSISD
jgi:hypothetical protein